MAQAPAGPGHARREAAAEGPGGELRFGRWCLQILVQHVEPHTADPATMHVDNVLASASDGRYTQAVTYLSSRPQSCVVELSGGPRFETRPDQGIFIPCDVQHVRTISNSTYSLFMQTLDTHDNILDSWYFEPLTFTLSELRALRTHVARSLDRVSQNVRPLHIPTLRLP
jgi:hypothetical protein